MEGIEKVKLYLEKFHQNLENRVKNLSVSSATVELAAQALGCEPARIAKSLSFANHNDTAILIVTAGDMKIDNAKFKSKFHIKAKMLTPENVIRLIGYPVGGVCPFGVNDGVKIFLDVSLKRFQTVFPACGTPHSAIEMTIDELEKFIPFESWIDVCKTK